MASAVADLRTLRGEAESASMAATRALRDARALSDARRDGGAAAGKPIACAGEACLRPGGGAAGLMLCERGECVPVKGRVTCPRGRAWDGRECVATGSACAPPGDDDSNRAFVYDSSGRCMATTDCAARHVKHPDDQRCVPDCGNARIFSYVMKGCVDVGGDCGTKKNGRRMAFDGGGRCTDTGKCSQGHVKRGGECIVKCRNGSVFSAAEERCVADGEACRETHHPDVSDPGLYVPNAVAPDGAVLRYKDGVCRPTGRCADDSQRYDREGGCRAVPACPEGFSKDPKGACVMSRAVGGEGRGSTRITGLRPSHRVRASYRFVKQARYRDGDYEVAGPGISGGAKKVRDDHVTKGGWATGATEYTYTWRNNDGNGTFTWTLDEE